MNPYWDWHIANWHTVVLLVLAVLFVWFVYEAIIVAVDFFRVKHTRDREELRQERCNSCLHVVDEYGCERRVDPECPHYEVDGWGE